MRPPGELSTLDDEVIAGQLAIRRLNERVSPPSPAQDSLYSLYQLFGDHVSRTLNMSGVYHVKGSFDIDRLDDAASRVVERHEILRTRYDLQGSRRQIVTEPWTVQSEVIPVTGEDSGNHLDRALQIACATTRVVFDLSKPQVLRSVVVDLGDDERLLAITVDHMACDRISFGLLMRELLTLYLDPEDGSDSAYLPDLPIQYSDYARWQRARRDSAESSGRELAYWTRQLEGIKPMGMPSGRMRPVPFSSESGQLLLQVGSTERADLASFAARHRVTVNSTIIAAVAKALSDAWSSDEITLVTFASQRTRPECRNLIGLFAGIVPLRFRELRASSWSATAEAAHRAVLGALAHSNLTFDSLLRIPGVMQLLDRSQHPWVMLHIFQAHDGIAPPRDASSGAFGAGYLSVSPISCLAGGSKRRTTMPFDVHITLWDDGRQLTGTLKHNLGVLDDDGATLLVTLLTSLLGSAHDGDG
jgi:Condensation domain